MPVSVLPPTFEHHHDGIGLQCSRPRISWCFQCSDKDVCDWNQTAYDLEISREHGLCNEYLNIGGSQSVLVPWPSQEASLKSRERCHVRVRAHHSASADGTEITEWSPWSTLEVALLDNSEWTGRMITTREPWPLAQDGSARPLSFRNTFDIPKTHGEISRARLFITSHGVYTVRLNGTTVGDYCLSPGWQSYHKRLHYQVHDVTHLLLLGSNQIEVDVAAGWFASATSWARKRFIYGDKLGVMAQLEVWPLGSREPWTAVNTDDSWAVSTNGLISSELYDGEVFDKRLDMEDGSASLSVQETPILASRLVSPEAAPIRVVERLEPKTISKSRSGKAVIIDFGQNFAGRVCVRKVHKASGCTITFRHAEVIEDGELMTRSLRSAKATDVLICDGSEILDWHPAHTFHGFRYVEVRGWSPDDTDCPLTSSSIVAEVLHTDMKRTGWFSCSNKDVNRLHENSLWGMKSNFLSVPLECPSRDERFGWTGDLNIFAPTATFLHDTSGMLKHWLDDLYLDQMDDSPHWRRGVVPLFVPNCLLRKPSDEGHSWDPMANAVWGDAAIMVPWILYRTTGDVELLSRQYDSMLQWLQMGVPRDEDGLWSPDQWQFGDWLDPRAPHNDSGRGTTDGTFVADCFLVHCTGIVAMVAKILGKDADAIRFTTSTTTLCDAWRIKYLSSAGYVVPDTATALSLAIVFDLIPSGHRERAASRLSRLVRFNDFKITSGFVGTAYLARALSKRDVELAYAMLFQKQCPSYTFPITMGATTSWERWDSLLPDGSVNPGSMISFNHTALGSIAHWLHADIGGLESIEPGWKLFMACPRPNVELGWAETIIESPYGRIELKWTLEDERFQMTLRVPPNSGAVVVLPDKQGSKQVVGSGLYSFECRFVQVGWPPKAILPPWGRAEF